MSLPETRCHAFVTGVVQGVGFRYFVADSANAAGISGWVRNLRDGRVEFVAEGSRADVERLLALARQGPHGGRVDGVEASWERPTGEYRGFRLQSTV